MDLSSVYTLRMKHKSVYIIDDDSITIFGLRKLLAKVSEDLLIQEFNNGKSALDAILLLRENKQALPEVIFLDINMPIMDGWTFLEEFLKLSGIPSTTIKIVTSSIDIRDRKKWESYANTSKHQIDFITKPIYELDLADMTNLHKVS